MNIDQQIGSQLKQLRSKKGLSLDVLAHNSGVSRATIARIEKSSVSPTTQVLAKLAKALSISVSELIIRCESSAPALIKQAQQAQWEDIENGYSRRCISPPCDEYLGEVLVCELQPNSHIEYTDTPSPDLEHHLYMQQGQLEITLGEQKYHLDTGDCLRYKRSGTTAFKVSGARKVIYVLVLVKS